MAPKRVDAARRAKKVFTSTRANPSISEEIEEGATDDDEEFNLPLNQEGLNPTFDRTLSPPTPRKGKGTASTSSAYSDSDALGTTTHNYILKQQADQEEQLRQLFCIVSNLGNEIRIVVKTAKQNPSSNSTEELPAEDTRSGPFEKKKGKKVAFGGLPLEQEECQENDDNNGDGDDENV
jgi:hypothetical protein